MPSEPQSQAEWWKEDAEIYNRVGQRVAKRGHQYDLGDENTEPEPADALAHLKQLPPADAVKKAREWTGRDDITTFEEAVAAVKETLGGE